MGTKQIPSRINIEGVRGSFTSTHSVELELSSAYKRDDVPTVIECHLVDNISDVSADGLYEARQMPFLKGKQLADSGRGNKIDSSLVCQICLIIICKQSRF